jgi:uncharacterized repeat protein (TIGR03803 family)
MWCKEISIRVCAILAFVIATSLLSATRLNAQTEELIYSFEGNMHGLFSGVIFGPGGVLYGTAFEGGALSEVFELEPSGSGVWTESLVYNFLNGIDGPGNSPLVADSLGNLYGTTGIGGTLGGGTVFELIPAGGGLWTEKVLYNFNITGEGGNGPFGSLAFDQAGNLYGTTTANLFGTAVLAPSFYGTVYELMPGVNGSWTEKTLHRFTASGEDGNSPYSGVMIDGAGNLYGTTAWGGSGCGTVFMLMPTGGGSWTEKILHRFIYNHEDGCNPYTGLVLDANGNLYGTTVEGGVFGWGTVFELIPSADGGWGEKILHSFGSGVNGSDPESPLLLDASGNLYGATYEGGTTGEGTVYELSPSGGGRWSEKILHNFRRGLDDGHLPQGALIFDSAGNLYGTAFGGGANGKGAVFEITP